MPDRIITAEAIITAKDGTGDVFARIGKKLEGVGKSARSSKEVDKLTDSLAAAQKQYVALDKLQSSMKGLAKSRGLFNEQKNALQDQARAMRAAEGPTKQMETRYKQLQASVIQASAAMERQKTAFADARRAAENFGSPLGKIASEQARLRSVIDSTTKSIEHQAVAEGHAAAAHARAEKAAEKRAESIRHHGFGRFVAGAAAGAVGVHSVMRFAEAGIESGVERQHVVAGMKNAGMPDDEISRAQISATQISKNVPNLSITELMELHKEARSAVQHPEEVFSLMPDLAKATAVLKGMGAQNANVADLVKAGESLGLMNDPKRFHAFLNGQVKAMAVMGKTIDTTQIYEAAKYSKSAGSTLSDDFINLTLPSLIQEMHGSSAGDALSGLTKRWRGGLNHQHLAVQRLQQIGMLDDPKQIRRSKNGEILGYGGKLVGDDLLGSDPGKFFTDVLNPKMESAGIKSLSDKVKFLNETLPPTAANIGRILIQQEETLKQHRKNYEAAPDADHAIINQQSDPTVAMAALTASLKDLGAAASEAVLGPAAKGIGMVSGALKELASVAADHPYAAGGVGAGAVAGGLYGAGYLAYQISNGFGLGASATALDGSAAMLKEAAVALGAKSAAPAGVVGPGGSEGIPKEGSGRPGTLGVPEPAGTKPGIVGGGGWKGAMRGLSEGVVGAIVYEAGTRAITTFLDLLPHPTYKPGYDPQGIRKGGIGGDVDRLRYDFPAFPSDTPSDPWLNGERQAIERRSYLGAQRFRRDPEGARGEAYGRLPELPSLGGSPAPVEATVKPDQITAKIEGQATVAVTVRVDGPGEIVGQYAYSSGNVRAETGTTGAVSKRAANGRVAGPL